MDLVIPTTEQLHAEQECVSYADTVWDFTINDSTKTDLGA